jgi:hypothetical protein
MGDKSPKSKARDQKQKNDVKKQDASNARDKQVRQGPAPGTSGKK